MLQQVDLNAQKKAPEGIKIFCQHGFIFIPENISGNHVYGKCPFCGHKEHKHKYTFYINVNTRCWDCKSCKREGNFQTFLQEILFFSQKNFEGEAALRLQELRGITVETFKRWGVGYNPNNNTYILPIYDIKKEKIYNLYYWKEGVGIRSTASMSPGLFGMFNFNKQGQIWLCEGSWDALALDEILQTLNKIDEVVIAAPSAGVFKSEWTSLFKDRKVNVLYDNDDAGRGRYNKNGVGKSGMLLVHQLLYNVAKELKYIHWPNNYEKGFDVRDLYIKKCNRQAFQAYRILTLYLKKDPPEVENIQIKEKTKENNEIMKLDGEGMLHEDVYKEYEKYIYVKDRCVIDLMYGAIIANRLSGDPVWLFMVAPPGGSKTEFILSVDTAPLIYTVTGLSSKTLISGYIGSGGTDPSLLPMLDGKVLIIKDFTTILKQPKTDKEAIFGILRDAYDGKIDWVFGNGLQRRYIARFGIIAGVTPVIEIETENDTILGERFLRYNMPYYTEEENEQKEIIKCAIKNTTNENEIRDSLRKVGFKVLNYNFQQKPIITEEIFEKITNLAQWIAVMRGYINRQKYTELITHKPFVEVGTRIAKQLIKLSTGISMFRRETEISEYVYSKIITKVAQSTVPSKNNIILEYLYKQKEAQQVQEIAKAIGLPTITTNITLENLVLLNILERIESKTTKRFLYQITNKMRNLIDRSAVYTNKEQK